MAEPQQEKLALMYDMARSAKASNDATTAKKYYDMILLEDPLNWEPVFYSVYFTYATTKNGEIGNKAIEIKNCLNTTLLIVSKIADIEERNNALCDLKSSVSRVAVILQSMSINFYKSLPFITQNPLDKLSRTVLIAEILFTMGDGLRNNGLTDDAVEFYKQAIDMCESESFISVPTSNKIVNVQSTINRIEEAANYIRQTEPEYMTKRENWQNRHGSNKQQPQQQQQTSEPQRQTDSPAGPAQPNILVFGILSLAFAGILGLIFACIGKSKASSFVAQGNRLSGAAKVGAVFCTVGLIVSIVALALTALAIIISLTI